MGKRTTGCCPSLSSFRSVIAVLIFPAGLLINGCYLRLDQNFSHTSSSSSSGVPSTPTPIAPLDPLALSILPISIDSFDLTITPNASGTTTYKIAYQLGTLAPINCLSGTIADVNTTSTNVFSIHSLASSTNYSFRVCAVNNNLISTGLTQTLRTNGIPPVEVSHLTFNSINDNNIHLVWEDGGGTTTGFRIAYQSGSIPPADCSSGTIIDSNAITGTDHNIVGLSTLTTYSFRVCAVNDNTPIDATAGITKTGTTKKLATGIRTIYTSDRSDGNTSIGINQIFGDFGLYTEAIPGNVVLKKINLITGATSAVTFASGTPTTMQFNFFTIIEGSPRRLVFSGLNLNNGNELHIYSIDDSSLIATEILDLGTNSNIFANMSMNQLNWSFWNGWLYFTSYEDYVGQHIYRTQGTPGTTELVYSSVGPGLHVLLGAGSQMYLTYFDYNTGTYMYKLTLGAPSTISLITPICAHYSCDVGDMILGEGTPTTGNNADPRLSARTFRNIS